MKKHISGEESIKGVSLSAGDGISCSHHTSCWGEGREMVGRLWRAGSSIYSIASAEPNPPGAASPLTPLNDTSGAAAQPHRGVNPSDGPGPGR